MVKSIIFLSILLFFGAGCHRPLGPAHNMEKWLLNEGDDRRPLNGHPKEIREYDYNAVDTDNLIRRRRLCDRYGFNADGDVVSHDTYLNDTLVFTWKGGFDANGYQWHSTDLTNGHSSTGVTRRLEDGRFKTVERYPDSSFTMINSFSLDGKEMTREFYGDTAARHKTREAQYYYDGLRVVKIKVIADGTAEKRFFYSRYDTPDSTQLRGDALISWLVEREYYFMNGHGDPSRYVRMQGETGSDTLQLELYQYVYDRHGNWTQKITTVLKSKDPSTSSVVDREFVY
jgi:hypothetical protein